MVVKHIEYYTKKNIKEVTVKILWSTVAKVHILLVTLFAVSKFFILVIWIEVFVFSLRC